MVPSRGSVGEDREDGVAGGLAIDQSGADCAEGEFPERGRFHRRCFLRFAGGVIASDAQKQITTEPLRQAQRAIFLLRLRKSRWMRELRDKKV
jgi:hypothetical protein